MIGAALALRFAPHAIALAVVAGGLFYVAQLRSANATQTLAITQLQKRAVELHGAWQREHDARTRADASNARLSRSLLAGRARAAARDASLRALARDNAKVRQWRADDVADALDSGLRNAYAGATGPRRADTAARDTDQTVPGAS